MAPSASTPPPGNVPCPPTQPSSSCSKPDASLSGDSESSAVELDLRGEVCPFTFVRTRLMLESLALGATLRVLLDHEPALRNIPRSATAWGQEVLCTELVESGLWALTIRKHVQ